MKFPEHKVQAWLQIHFATLLFGSAALFGRGLTLDPLIIVWGRVLFASATLGLVLGIQKKIAWAAWQENSGALIGQGLLLAFHWYSFFRAVAEAKVGLALISFASFPLFTLLLENAWYIERWRGKDLFKALLIILGNILLFGQEYTGQFPFSGIIWGLFSALSFALLAIRSKGLLQKTDAWNLSLAQDLIAFLVLSVLWWWDAAPGPKANDWYWLLLLGTVFTALAHGVYTQSLKKLKASEVSRVAALEPIYGILAAWIIFGEQLSMSSSLAGALIILAGLPLRMPMTLPQRFTKAK